VLKAKLKQDLCFLKKTFSLAKKGEGFTSPNPLVGALFVKNNKILSFGYHHKAGGPHAEVEAIRAAKKKLSGSTLYINLEPCCCFGRTGPCVDEIIKKGIKRVVIATEDPNPRVNGKSIRKLRKAGIKVEVGLCKKEAQELNETFFKNMREKKPFVVAKVAQSLDGKIATQKGIFSRGEIIALKGDFFRPLRPGLSFIRVLAPIKTQSYLSLSFLENFRLELVVIH